MRFARSLKIVFGFAAIGSGSLLLAGTALADSVSTSPISVVSTDANISIDSHSTQLKSETTTITSSADSKKLISPSADPTVGANGINKAEVQSAASESDKAPATAISTANLATTSLVENTPASMPVVASQPIISASQPTTYAYLTSSFGISSPSYTTIPATVTLLATQAQTQAPVTPKAPVAPFGAVGALLSLFANAIPVRLPDLDVSTLGFAFLSILLIVMAGRIHTVLGSFVFNFGAWLRQTGYLAVTSAGLPVSSSRTSISMVMDYVCAPAPYA